MLGMILEIFKTPMLIIDNYWSLIVKILSHVIIDHAKKMLKVMQETCLPKHSTLLLIF